MNEVKKSSRRYEAVVGKTLDETAGRLNDAVNRIENDGYSVSIETKDMPEGQGFGYMLHGILKSEMRPELSMGEAPPELLEFLRRKLSGNGGPDSNLADRSRALVKEIGERVSSSDWLTLQKELPAILPSILQNVSSSDKSLMLEDFEKSAKEHVHEDETEKRECYWLSFLNLTISLLRDNIRLSLQ